MYTPVDQLSGGPQRQTAAAPMYGSGGMTPLPWLNRGGGGLFPGAGGGGPRPLPGSTGGGWGTPPWGGQAGSAQPRGVAFRPNPQPLPWNSGGAGWGDQMWSGGFSPRPTPYTSPTGSAGVVGGPQNMNGGFMPGTMPQNFNNPIGNNSVGNGGMGNIVKGLGSSAHDLGQFNNYGQLDPTGTKMWAGSGAGGGQGAWQNYNPNDQNQSQIHNMFQRYGSGWYSGNSGAYGHMDDMAPQFQALTGRQGTPQELQDLYMGVNPGQQQAAHNAFAAQSSSYNPASSSYSPQAVQNLTSLNLLAHQ